MNRHSPNKPWAKLFANNPEKEIIPLFSQLEEPYEGQIKTGCQIYYKFTGNAWIRNVSASPIKIDDDWLEAGEEKEMSGGEKVSFNKDQGNHDDRDQEFDYVFTLMNSHLKNANKRNREESPEPLAFSSNQEAIKLTKVSDELGEGLTCSICKNILHKYATLNPCLHTFCSLCLLHSLESSVKCPDCRTKATSVAKNFALDNLVELTLKNFPEKERPKEEIEQKNIELKGTIVRKKGWTYVGDYKHEKREGEGTLLFKKNGKICKGRWENDVMQKVAEMRTKEGVYEGETENFQMHGRGIWRWYDGDIYEGDFVRGAQEGSGIFRWNGGDIYEGDFVRGAQEGLGTLKGSNGTFYKGEWKNDKKHGTGVGIFENGDRYEGSWVKDNCHGKGQYIWADGSKYEGDWVKGYQDGTGTMKFSDGRIYEGKWKNGNQNGGGVLTLCNGDKYEGTWTGDVLQSARRVYYANGDIYEGELDVENLQKHGEGVLTFKNGDKYEGSWLNDKQHGKGRETCKRVFEGAWKEGAMVGEITMIDANGTKFKAEWKKVEGE